MSSTFTIAFFALPRELRDQIYQHLFEDRAGKHFYFAFKHKAQEAESPSYVPFHVDNFRLPKYADSANVGHRFASEALDYAYSIIFRKCCIHPWNLTFFLQQKLPGVYGSVAQFVRKVDVEWANRDPGSGLLTTRDLPEKQLEALSLLQHDRGVVVNNLIRCAMMEHVGIIGRFIEKFRPIYEHLESCGIEMRFRGEEKFEPFKYFTSPDEWKDQFLAIKKKV